MEDAVGFGEEARVALGVERVVRILQALHRVVLPIEYARERMLGIAK